METRYDNAHIVYHGNLRNGTGAHLSCEYLVALNEVWSNSHRWGPPDRILLVVSRVRWHLLRALGEEMGQEAFTHIRDSTTRCLECLGRRRRDELYKYAMGQDLPGRCQCAF